jgi:hypothetical protein
VYFLRRMTRVYQKKTTRGADGGGYTMETLRQAIEAVKDKRKTVRGAANKDFKIPRSTLRHYLDGSRGVGLIAKQGRGGGGKVALSEQDEKDLAEGLKVMERWGFGLSIEEVLDVVECFVKMKNLKTRFKNGRPGTEWLINFRKRNNLSIKKPQAVESARMKQINPFVIYGFYDLLETVVKELQLEHRTNF